MRPSFITPIPELYLAAKLLDAAADALLSDRSMLAAELIVRANFPEITNYARRIVGKLSLEVHRHTDRPRCLPKSLRDTTRMPSPREQKEIFERDGWRCRFCGVNVVCKSARSLLTSQFSIKSIWTSIDLQGHSALYAMASSIDHVIPHGRGGNNERSNLVTACYCCQFGRGESTLEEVELLNPLLRNPHVDSWDGLSRLSRPSIGFKRIAAARQ